MAGAPAWRASDHRSTVWLNGTSVGRWGCSSPGCLRLGPWRGPTGPAGLTLAEGPSADSYGNCWINGVLRAPTAVPTYKIAPAPVTLRAATIGDDRTGARPRHRRRHLSYWAGRKRLDRPPRLEEARLASSRALGCPIWPCGGHGPLWPFPQASACVGPLSAVGLANQQTACPLGRRCPNHDLPKKSRNKKRTSWRLVHRKSRLANSTLLDPGGLAWTV